jgi:hypothetical protein
MLGNKLISGVLMGLGIIILAVTLLHPNSFGSQQINLKNSSSALKNSSSPQGVARSQPYNSSTPAATNTPSPSASNPTPTTTQSPPSARW